MKKLILEFVLFFAFSGIFAQKIQTVDMEGNPVAYAHIMGEDGKMIGITDMDGKLDDVRFDQTLTVRHVAFKEKKIFVKGEGFVRIPLEDSDYGLGEIVVKPKEYIYVQTYYRMIYMTDDTMEYCRFGIIDNTYNVKKKDISSSHSHLSKASMGLLKTILDGLLGRIIDSWGDLPTVEPMSADKQDKQSIRFVKDDENRQRIYYKDSLVGYVVNDYTDHLRRFSVDREKLHRIRQQETTDKKKSKKKKDKSEEHRNVQHNFYKVYQIDDEGRYGVEDFVMSQWHDDYDKYDKYYKKDRHVRIWLETYSTDREYVDKAELKEKIKANKVKMTYPAILEFERKHNIPALPTRAKEELTKLFNK